MILPASLSRRALIHLAWMILVVSIGHAQNGKVSDEESFALEDSVAKHPPPASSRASRL